MNAVAPGSFPDPVTSGDHYEASMARAAANAPGGRAGHVREIGYAVAFLATTDADYIVGQTLSVDGGGSLL